QRSRDRAELVQPWDGQTVTVTVQLQREARPHEQGSIADAALVGVNERAGPLDVPVVVLGGTRWLDLPFGARVRTRARLAVTEPGQDRALLVVARDIEEVTPPSGWRASVAGIRGGLAQLAAPLSPAARGLVPGIALGDTRMLPARLKTDLQITSLTHLTAISGAHVALVMAVVLVALWWAPRWIRALVGAVVLVAFVALVRAEGSVLRAGVMGADAAGPRAAAPAHRAAGVVLRRGGAHRRRPVDRPLLRVRPVRTGHLGVVAGGAVVGGANDGGASAGAGDRTDRAAGRAVGVSAGAGAASAAVAGLRGGGQYSRRPGGGAGHDPGGAGRAAGTALAGSGRGTAAPGGLVRRVGRHCGHHVGGAARCGRGVAGGRPGGRAVAGRRAAAGPTAPALPGARRGGAGGS